MQIQDPHWHLLVNHFPIVLSMAATCMLLLALMRRQQKFAQTSLLVMVAAGLSGILANSTGEGAEEAVENLPGFSGSLIHQHEDAAYIGMIVLMIAGGLALLAWLWLQRAKGYRLLPIAIVTIAAIAASGGMMRTGYSGGQIRHSEIRKNDPTVQQPVRVGTEDDD
jgi:uncharacterized membrane protein